MHNEGFFFQAFIYLLAAVLSVPLFKRLGLGSVLGYLLAGVVIGPFGLKLVGEGQTDVMHFAEFGVVMMLFLIGLELQPSLLWRLRVPILGMGGLQVGLTTVLICGVGIGFGLGWKASLAAGAILALSSTAIVLQTLNEKGLIKTEAGQSAFSVLLFQDIAVIPILALLPLLAFATPDVPPSATEAVLNAPVAVEQAHAETLAAPPDRQREEGSRRSGGEHALMVLGVVAAIILAGRFLVRHVFRFIAETKLREVFTAAALLMVIGIALAMQSVGLSPALGTFLAGVVLADNEYRHELESDIEPFKGLLLGLFFISVGASIDFLLFTAQPWLILGLVAGLVVVKLAVLLILGRVFKMPSSERYLFSFALAQGGEFAFVLLSFATRNQVLTLDVANPLVVAVAFSMLLTPLLMIVNEKLIQPRFSGVAEEREADEIDERENPVIIAGYGRFGQIVGRLLLANGIKTTVLDHDPAQIEMLRKFGYKVFYGNASRLDLLHAAGAEQARLFILAIDEREEALQTVETVRKHFPNLRILARAQDRIHAYELMRLGVESIQRETFDAALEMGEEALRSLGYRAHLAHRLARRFKRHDEQAMRRTVAFWGDEKAYIIESRKQMKELEDVLKTDHAEAEPESDSAWDTTELRENIRKGEF